jgi:hypothetical protein
VVNPHPRDPAYTGPAMETSRPVQHPTHPRPLPADAPLWYVSYGSNMCATRFACYLEGGRPSGGNHTNPGAHDPSPPVRDVPVDLPGTVYFAGDSLQWGGGVAFYDHETPGPSAARAYLVTARQFADIAAQEMRRRPAPGDPLVEVVLGGLGGDGARHRAGPGRYETLVQVGTLDAIPMLTFTSPHGCDGVPHTAPAAAYVALLASGLAASRGWTPERAVAYVRARAGSQPLRG